MAGEERGRQRETRTSPLSVWGPWKETPVRHHFQGGLVGFILIVVITTFSPRNQTPCVRSKPPRRTKEPSASSTLGSEPPAGRLFLLFGAFAPLQFQVRRLKVLPYSALACPQGIDNGLLVPRAAFLCAEIGKHQETKLSRSHKEKQACWSRGQQLSFCTERCSEREGNAQRGEGRDREVTAHRACNGTASLLLVGGFCH